MTALSKTAVSRARSRRRGSRWLPRLAVVSFLTMTALFFGVPLYVVIVTSFKTMDEIRLGDILALPNVWSLQGWHYALFELCPHASCSSLGAGFLNSATILIPSLILSISLSIVTGYAIAMARFRWANGLLFTMFVCAFVPFQILMFPLIKVTAGLNLFGTTFGVGLVHAALAMPILTLIFTNYFRGLPQELFSAAMIDSGSFVRIFFEIVLPMSGNILIVVLILQTSFIWNDFLIGSTFGSTSSQPMMVVLNNMNTSTTSGAAYNGVMAGALLTAALPLVIYLALGKFFVEGVTAGALKG